MDRYGAYVLEHCLNMHTVELAELLIQQSAEDVFCSCNSGSVIAKLIQKLDGELWSALAQRIIRNPETVLCMAKGRRGHQVIADLLRRGGPCCASLQTTLQPHYNDLKLTRYGRTINKLVRDGGTVGPHAIGPQAIGKELLTEVV